MDEISSLSASLCSVLPEGARLLRLRETESTNTLARALLSDCAAPHGTVIIADRQTGGRGRHGKAFFSPEGGLYLSLIWKERPNAPFTVLAAAAVCRVLRQCGAEVSIKWVNDLFWEGKKVCGILCERVESNENRAVIIGIGVNCGTVPFPTELSSVAGNLPPLTVTRSELSVLLLRELVRLLQAEDDAPARNYYAAHMLLYGKRVRFVRNGEPQHAVVLGLGDKEELLVRLDSGEELALTSGIVIPE